MGNLTRTEEVEQRKEGTLFLTTASESSSNSRTFRLKVKPGCNLGKVRSNVSSVLKEACADKEREEQVSR